MLCFCNPNVELQGLEQVQDELIELLILKWIVKAKAKVWWFFLIVWDRDRQVQSFKHEAQ